jgi:hypothetical protein
MIKFCRNCGEVLSNPTDKTCPKCSSNPTKATAFCRYCGKPTNAQDNVCPNCGAAVRPTPNAIRLLNPDHIKLMRLGKIINISIVVILVVAYVIFTLPKAVTKPVAQAASDVVMGNTGYTTMPLVAIEATPPLIPELMVVYMTYTPPGITVNTTRQITVYARYESADSENATKSTRLVNITTNCTYRSSNDGVATCNASGVVLATGSGAANITPCYTVAPGSANMSNAAAGKIPVTFTTNVLVLVK